MPKETGFHGACVWPGRRDTSRLSASLSERLCGGPISLDKDAFEVHRVNNPSFLSRLQNQLRQWAEKRSWVRGLPN